MMALLPPGKPPGILFQALFLQQLPADMCDHLVAANLQTPREMAVTADRMWDSRSEKVATVVAVRGVSPAAVAITALQVAGPEGLCFYYSHFAAKAHRCQPPCTWSGAKPAGNGSTGGGN